jgi:hypothetical protein
MKKTIIALLMLFVMTPLALGAAGPRTGNFEQAIEFLDAR